MQFIGGAESESESVNMWKWKCENESVKMKVWKWKCESESVKVKVWKWKCESESVKVKVWKQHSRQSQVEASTVGNPDQFADESVKERRWQLIAETFILKWITCCSYGNIVAWMKVDSSGCNWMKVDE